MTNSQQHKTTASALYVAQEAVRVLANWVGFELPGDSQPSKLPEAVVTAKEILSWPTSGVLPQPLRLLFDKVHLSQCQFAEHYWPATYIEGREPQIPYPQLEKPEQDKLKQIIRRTLALERLKDENNWHNLSLLSLILEKFGSYISFGESDVSLVDMARSTAAVAASLTDNPKSTHLSLVAGDLSGIQKFIYTISSAGALKSLRARSFYLELVTEEVVQQLLTALQLPRTNVIYAGGGNLYVLAPASDETKNAVKQVRQNLNQWLLEEFQGKVFLALDGLDFLTKDVANQEFAVHWSSVTKRLALQKSQKFADQIEHFIQCRPSHEPCRVCHRDDVENLQPLNRDEADSPPACGTCRLMFCLGGQLLRVEAIVRSPRQHLTGAAETKLCFQLSSFPVYYHVFKHWDWKQASEVQDSETVFLVNDWMVDNYRSGNVVPLLLGNYGQESQEEPGFMRAGEMVKQAQGIPRLGYLRMDVDRLGQIFARGLGENQTLPRLAALSRQMSYFFKVYLNSLAGKRLENLPKPIEEVKCLTEKPRQNLLFIYAGGDDLFVSGTWNEVVEFSLDVYQCFRAYTGKNPDITLSGGISIDDVKFPLYQAADESGQAEDSAKGNGRDSLGLFEQVFKWDEWLGTNDGSVIDSEISKYLSPEILPSLFGIFPFVEKLETQRLEINYARSFVRNLLATAQIQEQMIRENDKQLEQVQDIRYYLHLPKVAYTLARLPSYVRDAPNFQPVRQSLLSPYNAPYFRAIATWIELLNRL